MNGQRDRGRPQLRHGLNAFALTAFMKSIAGEIGVFVGFLYFQQEIIHGIAEAKQLDVGLESQTKVRAGSGAQICRAESRLVLAVKSLDLSPLEFNDVEGQNLLLARP